MLFANAGSSPTYHERPSFVISIVCGRSTESCTALDVAAGGVGREQQRDRGDHREARAETDPCASKRGRTTCASLGERGGHAARRSMPLTHARCAESARCTACGNMPSAEQRAREQHPRPERARIAADEPAHRSTTSATASNDEQDEPDEELLRRGEPGERPRPIDGGDDAGDADEVIRVGRHGQVPRRRAGGSSGRRSCPRHTLPGPGRGQLHEVRRETDAPSPMTARLTTGRGSAHSAAAPPSASASPRSMRNNIASPASTPPAAPTVRRGSAVIDAPSCRACSSATNAPSASAAPPVHGIAIELQRRHHEHDVEKHRRDRDPPAPPAHEQAGADAIPTSCTSPARRSTTRCVPKTL